MAEEEKLNDQIAKYLALRIDKEEHVESFWDKAIKIATFLSAVAALIGVLFSLYTSYQSLILQKEIDKRQVKINENSNIVNLGYHRESLGFDRLECSTLSIENDNLWQQYHQCLFNLPIRVKEQLSFKNVENKDRYRCLSKETVKLCRGTKKSES